MYKKRVTLQELIVGVLAKYNNSTYRIARMFGIEEKNTFRIFYVKDGLYFLGFISLPLQESEEFDTMYIMDEFLKYNRLCRDKYPTDKFNYVVFDTVTKILEGEYDINNWKELEVNRLYWTL